jgi:hypothetical protein
MPLGAVQELLFCEQDFDVEDVIDDLEPLYDRNEDYVHLIVSQLAILSINDKGKRSGILVDLLRDRCESNNEFLRDFVWFITGSSFIQRSTLKMTVEFNYTESRSFDSLPVAHTCVKTLKLPGLAYDGNRELLEQKLDISIQNSKKCLFDMA